MMVWRALQTYLAQTPRGPDDLLFTTRTGCPVVHGYALIHDLIAGITFIDGVQKHAA